MSSEDTQNHELRLAHVPFVDIVGYSKLPINRQSELLRQLNQIVRGTEQFRRAEAADKLVRLPTGDGMALVFFTSPDAPVRCALEISEGVGQALPPAGGKRQAGALALQLRMGINSGPVDAVADVNDRSNVAGAGINMAQRVMDCCDANHILLSKRVADDLGQYEEWQPYLHELGLVEVKHGVRVEIVNFYSDKVGNPELPEKVKRAREVQSALDHRASKVAVRKWALLFGLVLLLAIGVLGSWLLFRRVAQRSTNATSLSIPDKSIAVLPLENLSEEKENAFFADGIQEELLSSLAKIKDLKVISRTSVMQYKTGITRNLKEIAQQLGVSNVIEGSVRRSGNHIRVSVQLIDALTDRHIWVQDYDRTMADSLALQGELATEIAAGVGATLSPQEKARVEAKPTNNTAAYDAYLRGRAFAAGSPFDKPTVEGAIHSYQEAVKLDPTFVLAWACLSSVQSNSYWLGLDPSPARLAAAKDSLDRARALDPNLPETHLALGYYRYYGQRDFAGALAEFQLAEINLPNNVDVLKAIGLIQRRLGHWDQAIAVLRRVVELDPRNINLASTLALTYMAVRHFSDAAAIADHILTVEPTNASGIGIKAFALWSMGDLEATDALAASPHADVEVRGYHAMIKRRYAEAVDILSKALNDSRVDDKKSILLSLGLAQQRAGNVAGARAAYQQAAHQIQGRLEKTGFESGPGAELHSFLGLAYAGLGDATSAVAEGQKGMLMQPSSEDPFEGPGREAAMAQIYALLGDADHAIPILKRLLQTSAPTEIVPTLLRLDPIWDSIRDDPRFQELVAEKKP
jgi:TolB-like protein/class 3 adenylate cyclase/Tfp pilus assembly protein PilF